MKNKLKLIALAFAGLIGIMSLAPTPVLAADVCSSSAPDEVKKAAGCPVGTADPTLQTVISNILKAVIGVAGLVAVVYIVIGGVQYMTSAGDSGKTAKAKNTILYALIGLIVCALAFAIVNWTIGAINGNSGSGDGGDGDGDGTSLILDNEPIAFLEK